MKLDLEEFQRSIVVRPLRTGDYERVKELQRECFPKMEPWGIEQFESQLEKFPEGQICVEFEGEIVASSASLIVDYDLYSDWHDWKVISDKIPSENPSFSLSCCRTITKMKN